MAEQAALPATMAEEFQLAKEEGRQPRCIYCGKPLEVTQTQDIYLYWRWDDKQKRYVKSEGGGSAEKPYCLNCETRDWDFTNNELIRY